MTVCGWEGAIRHPEGRADGQNIYTHIHTYIHTYIHTQMTVWGSEDAIQKAVQMVKTELALLQEEKFPIAESLHGTLIGVGGQTVKKMEEMSGTRIAFQVCMYVHFYPCYKH
jgi:hypothetical protein